MHCIHNDTQCIKSLNDFCNLDVLLTPRFKLLSIFTFIVININSSLHDIRTIGRLRETVASLDIGRNLPVLDFRIWNSTARHQLPQKHTK